MFSKILLKLIDQAIIPALLIVVVRFLSIVLISNQLDIEYSITKKGVEFATEQSYIFVNSYSLLSIIILISLGMVFTLISSALFHHEHIKPATTAKLFSLKLSSLIRNSFEIYTKVVIWLSYMWLLLFTAGLMVYFDMIYKIIFDLIAILTATFTVLVLLDVEKKFDVAKNKDFIFDTDRKFLEKDK